MPIPVATVVEWVICVSVELIHKVGVDDAIPTVQFVGTGVTVDVLFVVTGSGLSDVIVAVFE